MYDPDADDNSRAANLRKAVRLTSQIATAICAHHRIRQGQAPVAPATDLVHAANFLYMLTGERPSAVTTQAFDASPRALRRARAERLHLHHARDRRDPVRHALGGGRRRGRAQGHAPRRRRRGGDAHADGDRRGRQRRRVRRRRRSPRSAGSWASATASTRRATRARPSCKGMAEEACRQSGQAKWYDMAVKLHEPHQRGQEAHPQRRLLLGAALLLARHPGRPVHAGDRGRPHRRLDGQPPRAVRRQPADPPPRRLHRRRGRARPRAR